MARRAALDAMAAIRTIESEEDGRRGLLDLACGQCWCRWDGAGAPGGPPKAEPGAGSAGRGAGGAALIQNLRRVRMLAQACVN